MITLNSHLSRIITFTSTFSFDWSLFIGRGGMVQMGGGPPFFMHGLRWLDPVFLWGYDPTLKLSGIPTFTFNVSLTHRMDNI